MRRFADNSLQKKKEDLEKENQLFLQALQAFMKNEKVLWEKEISAQEWHALFRRAEQQQLFSMFYESVYTCRSFQTLSLEERQFYKSKMIRIVTLQAMKSETFTALYQKLLQRDLQPLVVKGIVLRSFYQNPDYRPSGDEDLLICAEQQELFRKVMLENGFVPLKTEEEQETAYEIPYGKAGSPLYIEAHKSLFPPESEAYGELNRYFQAAMSGKQMMDIGGSKIFTLGATDHLFYLICHALKHFIHSGFGIRQVCDIVVFANACGKEIDWQRILRQCREIRAEKFTAAIFRIGSQYLTFDKEVSGYPTEWQEIAVDESRLLEDLLDGGIYGDASLSRKHSSNLTLQAVAAQKQGEKRNSLFKTVFPAAKDLEGRYLYLKKRPYLLPAAWTDRLLTYVRETKQVQGNSMREAVSIGNRRIDLLQFYNIL